MPFILKNKTSAEIFTCSLINAYDLPYYGTAFWGIVPSDEAYLAFLQEREVSDAEQWELQEVEEEELKIFNVKLKNNSSNRLFIDANGKPVVRSLN